MLRSIGHRSTCGRFSQNRNFLDAFWALSIHPKLKKLWKQRALIQYFPGKVPKLFQNANHSTRNFRHSGAKLNVERKLPDDNFRKVWYILRKCCSFRYCMEVAENLNQTFWLNGTAPIQRWPNSLLIVLPLCARVRAPLKKFLKSNIPLVWSMKSWFNLTDYWKQKLCFDLFIILISI